LPASSRPEATRRPFSARTDGCRRSPRERRAAVRAASLIALRERELGILDSGALVDARALAASLPSSSPFSSPAAFSTLFDVIDTLRPRGAAGLVANEQQIEAVASARRNRIAWTELLRAQADQDELSAYLWLAFNCTYNSPGAGGADPLLDLIPTWRESPLLQFRRATCVAFSLPALDMLLQEDDRFVEVAYYKGLQAVISGDLDAADAEFERAYTWRPRWPSVATSRGNVLMTAEDFDRAADFYDRALALTPDHVDAMLGKLRALTFAGRYEAALAVSDTLLALQRWYVGDARYWRAVNELQLGHHDQAWDDIEQAALLIRNADVPKLAGVIAVRRQHPAIARLKFEEALKRNPDDCETSFYLGTVLADERQWGPSVNALARTTDCLAQAQRALEAEIARLRASDATPERRARQIARREQQVAANVRMAAASFFNAAAGCFNLARYDEARSYADQVKDDPQFGARALELVARIPDGKP
jgi:tetratricopeptide (TPR) repeat protein